MQDQLKISHSMNFLGIIPAKGRSSRLKQKNLQNMGGKPLVQWTIEAASNSKKLSEFMISTDNQEIADIAEKFGAKIPFLRPEELCEDSVPPYFPVEHAINFYQKELGKGIKYAVVLQPTSPLRNAGDIDRAIELLMYKKGDAVISVCECSHSPLWCNQLPEDLSMNGFISEEIVHTRSQDLPKYYQLNGAIFICETKRLLQEKTWFIKDNIYAYVMPEEKSIDIDSLSDLVIAETLINFKTKR